MDTATSFVRVRWKPSPHSLGNTDLLRVVAVAPGIPVTTAVLHRTPAGDPLPDDARFADEHLVVDATEASPWPQIADVLIIPESVSRRSAVRAESPGWLVAAFTGPDQDPLLEVATGWLARLVPLAAGISGPRVWPYASFVHAWTVAGRPLDALHGARLMEGPPGTCRGVQVIAVEDLAALPAAA